MDKVVLAAAVCIGLASACARAQTFVDLRKTARELAPNALVPLHTPANLIPARLAGCGPPADRAEVQKKLEDAAGLASNVATAVDLVLELIPETHRAGEALAGATVLLSTVKKTAGLLELWDRAQTFYYGTTGQNRFEVCTPLPGLLVVRPLANAAPAPSATPLPGIQRQSLPLIGMSQMRLNAPPCTSSLQAPANRLALMQPSIQGRVRHALTGLPVEGALVTLLGPTPSSCRTPADGTFVFEGLASGSNYEVSAYWLGMSASAAATVGLLSRVTLRDFMF